MFSSSNLVRPKLGAMCINRFWQAEHQQAFSRLAQTGDPRRMLAQSETSQRFIQFSNKRSVSYIFISATCKEGSVAADDSI